LKVHPNNFVLEEFLLSLSKDHLAVLEHLTRCTRCRHLVQGLRDQHLTRAARRIAEVLPWPGTPADYAEAFRESQNAVLGRGRMLEKERADAPALFVELLGLPPEQRDLVLRNVPRFHTWGLFELLVERSLEETPKDPAYGEELGLLALRLSDSLDAGRYGPELIEDLRARAWGYIGNACRVKSDLQGAEEAFASAYRHLKAGSRDAFERALLLDLEASLRRDQRRFEDALKLLRRAVAIFLQNNQRHRAGRSLVNLSTVHHYTGNVDAAIQALSQALELIDPEQEPRLLLCAKHNLADDLAEAGRYLDAQKVYRKNRPLYRNFPDLWTQNRRKWVKGKIARGLGQADQAESLFRAARDGFIAEGIPYDTALVSLELATLYAEQGRMADLKRLAGEMVPIFSSLHIHREALAALAYLKQAVEAERASVELVTGVAAFLRQARHDPGLRFQASEGQE
jgi:tetratricopeptide (TPR) repeat protein